MYHSICQLIMLKCIYILVGLLLCPVLLPGGGGGGGDVTHSACISTMLLREIGPQSKLPVNMKD